MPRIRTGNHQINVVPPAFAAGHPQLATRLMRDPDSFEPGAGFEPAGPCTPTGIRQYSSVFLTGRQVTLERGNISQMYSLRHSASVWLMLRCHRFNERYPVLRLKLPRCESGDYLEHRIGKASD